MIYTKIWKEYGYKKENSSEADEIGITYVIKYPFGIYYKDGAVLYDFVESPKIAIYL